MIEVSESLVPKGTHWINNLIDILMMLNGLSYVHAPEYSLMESIRQNEKECEKIWPGVMQEIEKEIYRSIISIKAMGFECVSRDLAPELSSSLSRLADERDYAVSKISRYHHDMVNISKYLIPKRTHHMNVLVDALMALYGLTYTHAPDYSLIENIRDFDSHEMCLC